MAIAERNTPSTLAQPERASFHNSNRVNDTFEVLKRIKTHSDIWPFAKVVGAWVWIEFPSKPEQSIRAFLLAEGFHWNHKRSAWQHCGGKPSRHSQGNPKFNYGEVPANLLESEVG
jgi:hypothetical protein